MSGGEGWGGGRHRVRVLCSCSSGGSAPPKRAAPPGGGPPSRATSRSTSSRTSRASSSRRAALPARGAGRPASARFALNLWDRRRRSSVWRRHGSSGLRPHNCMQSAVRSPHVHLLGWTPVLVDLRVPVVRASERGTFRAAPLRVARRWRALPAGAAGARVVASEALPCCVLAPFISPGTGAAVLGA